MEYEQPCRFPADDPNRLWILVAGRQLPYGEALRWFSVLRGKRKTMPLIGFVLCLLYATVTLSFITEAAILPNEKAAAAAVILTSVVWLSLMMFFMLSRPKKLAKQQIADYEADVERHAYGSRIALYTDRIEIITLRGTRVMRFTDVELCMETYDGFALICGDTCMILRSEDLTPYDLQLIREYLTERLSPRVMCCKTAAQARLFQPLPIPQFESRTLRLTSATVSLSDTLPYQRGRKTRFFLLSAVITPLMMAVGTMMATVFMITSQFLIDLAIFCGAWMVGGAAVSVGLFFLFERRCHEQLQIGFEPDGLRLTTQHTEHFIIKERVWLSVEEGGVTLRFYNHETLCIPTDAVEDIAVLKALAGVE